MEGSESGSEADPELPLKLKQRDESISVYRAQIQDLRKREASLTEELARVRQQAQGGPSVSGLPGPNLDDLDREEVERRYVVLLRNYNNERGENDKLANWLKQLRQDMKQKHGSVEERKALQQEHMKQAVEMKKLMETNAHLRKVKLAMKDQEKVILRLEDLLDAAVRKQQVQDTEMQRMAPELQLKLDESHQIIDQLQEDLGNAVANGPADPTRSSLGDADAAAAEVHKWRTKAEMLQTRLEETEAALETVPKAWAEDMAKLQIQLREKDAQLAGGFGSLSNLKLGARPSPGSTPPPRQGPAPPQRPARRGTQTPSPPGVAKSPVESTRGGSAGQRSTPAVDRAAWDAGKQSKPSSHASSRASNDSRAFLDSVH